jgi:hypothetical protein
MFALHIVTAKGLEKWSASEPRTLVNKEKPLTDPAEQETFPPL